MRSVEGWDADGDVRDARRGLIGVPPRAAQGHLGVGGDVEPDPPAVFEWLQPYPEFECGRLVFRAGELASFDQDPRTGGLGSVDVDATGPGQFGLQHDRFTRRPPPPVAGRECIEIGGERHLGFGTHLQSCAVGRVRAPRVFRRLLQVELAYVEWLTRAGQNNAGQQAHCFTRVSATLRRGRSTRTGRRLGCVVAGGFAHPRMLPLLFSSSGAPSRRCGARMLSYMLSALAMAMCMSRYW